MRILYGVCSEGMGHAIRSFVVASHLKNQGHQVLFASSGNALRYLKGRSFATIPIPGLAIAKRDNAIAPLETVLQNVAGQALGVFTGMPAMFSSLEFRPDVVISDFDPWSARLAKVLGAPLLAVDSIHFLDRCQHPREFRTWDADYTRLVAAMMVPGADHYFVCPLAFSDAPIKPECTANTTLHLPILRQAIVKAKTAEVGHHLTVYVNDTAAASKALRVLESSGLPCHIWVSGRSEITRRGNLVEYPFQDAAFIQDLATCKAVVGTAGALMGEAAYLGRPMLALPMGGHWEQWLNASYFDRFRFGDAHNDLTLDGLDMFFRKIPTYRAALAGLSHDGNAELFGALDRKLWEIAAKRRAS